VATYAETISRICDELSRPEEEMAGWAGQEIISAIKYYDGYRFYFNQRTLSVTFSATNAYAFASLVSNETDLQNTREIDNVRVIHNGQEFVLEKTSWQEFYDLDHLATSSTIPDLWSVYNRQLYIYPTPQGSISAQVDAHVVLKQLNGSTIVENSWLTTGEELIRSRACRMICLRKLDDFEKGNQYLQLEAEALRSLKHETNVMQHTGILTPND
jgi:hypothetical protein